MTFRTARTILSESAGSYVNGNWVAGLRTANTIQATVQPITMGQDMLSLPEGRRISDFVKIYTGINLQVTDDDNGLQPDFIVHEGFCYELVSRYSNQNGLIPHYKFIAVRQMKFTNTEDWLDGTIVRA